MTSFLVRIPVIGFRVTLIQYDFMLTWLHLQWPYFQISSHSQATRGISTWIFFFFWGCNSNHTHHIYYCLLYQSVRFTLKMEWIPVLRTVGLNQLGSFTLQCSLIHFSSNFSTYALMILPRQKKEAPFSLSSPSLSSYTLASFQIQLFIFHNSQFLFMPKLENWALKIFIGLYSLFPSSLKPLQSDVISLLLWCSVQFSHSVVSDSLHPQNLQHAGPPCSSPTPRVHSIPCPLSHDAIQPSHPLSSPSTPALKLSQHQGLFKWVSSSHQVATVLEFQLQHQSFQWTLRTDL